MATLTGVSISSSYTSLLKLDGNTDSTAAGNGSNAIQVKTGDNEATPLFLNTDRVGIGVQPYSPLHIKSDAEGSIGGLEATDGTFIPQVIIEGSGTTAAKMSPTLALFNSSTGADGDTLGSIMFMGGDDSNQPPSTIAEGSVYAGILAKITDETNSSNDGELHFLATSGNDNTNTAMSIVGKNVGIGTASPVAQGLTVANAGDVNLTLLADSDANSDNNWPMIDFRVDNTSGNPEARIYYKQDITSLVLATANTNAVYIDESQNVSIGTTATYGNLTVGGTGVSSSGELIVGRATSGAGSFAMYEAGTGRFVLQSLNGSNGISFKIPTTEAMRIESDGTADHKNNYIVNEQGRQNHVANTMSSPYYRFDKVDDVITVADSTVYEFGTSDFAISLWIYFENTVANQGIWEKRTDASNQIRVYTDADSNLNLLAKTSGSTRIHAETSGGLSAGEWYHLAIVCDRDSGNTIYINGVSQTLINNTKDDGAHSMAFGATTIGRSESSAQYFGGSMASLMLHNHALDATEVKELYSGMSVPYKYKGASQTSLVTGTDSTMDGSNNWVAGGGLGSITANYSADSRNVLRLVTDDGGANDRGVLAVTAVKGARYRIQYDYKAVQGDKGRVIWAGYDSGNQQLTSTSFATVTSEFTATSSGSVELTIYPSRADGPTGGSANDELLIDNLTLVRIGAVAEYDGSGIASDEWFDKSGNDLHGDVSGASVENAPSGDDGLVYEEGTWSPVICQSDDTDDVLPMHAETAGKYVRIGNTVTVTGQAIGNSSSGDMTASDSIAIKGLPYPVPNAQGNRSVASMLGLTVNLASGKRIAGYVAQNSSQINLYVNDGTSEGTLRFDEFTNAGHVVFQAKYII